MSELTGKKRFRINGEGGLVLQVETRRLQTYWSAGVIDSEWIKEWRDATIQDLTVHERLEGITK